MANQTVADVLTAAINEAAAPETVFTPLEDVAPVEAVLPDVAVVEVLPAETLAATAPASAPVTNDLTDFCFALDVLKAGEGVRRLAWGAPRYVLTLVQGLQEADPYFALCSDGCASTYVPTAADLLAEDWVAVV